MQTNRIVKKLAATHTKVQQTRSIHFHKGNMHDPGEIYKQLAVALKQPYINAVHCPLCGKELKYQPALSAHMREHSGTQRIRCSTCDTGFRCTRDLRTHMKKHGSNSVNNEYKAEQ